MVNSVLWSQMMSKEIRSVMEASKISSVSHRFKTDFMLGILVLNQPLQPTSELWLNPQLWKVSPHTADSAVGLDFSPVSQLETGNQWTISAAYCLSSFKHLLLFMCPLALISVFFLSLNVTRYKLWVYKWTQSLKHIQRHINHTDLHMLLFLLLYIGNTLHPGLTLHIQYELNSLGRQGWFCSG